MSQIPQSTLIIALLVGKPRQLEQQVWRGTAESSNPFECLSRLIQSFAVFIKECQLVQCRRGSKPPVHKPLDKT